MNYFLTKGYGRFITVPLVLFLILATLTGCQKKTPEATTPSTDDTTPPGLVEVKPTETEATEPPETTEPENDNMATVIGPEQLNVRSSPSTGAKIIGYLDPGTQVEIIKTEPYMGVEWALIREGWVVLDHLETNSGSSTAPTTPEETKPAETTPTGSTVKGTITVDGLNIRASASTTGAVKGTYNKGTVVTILETKNGWGRTDKGWISMQYVKTDSTTGTNNNTNTNNNTTTNNNNTTTTQDGNTYFITASELNIRQSAVNGAVIGSYVAGDKVVVNETSNGWGKTDKGWISMQYAYKTGSNGTNGCKGIVTGDTLNVRSGPGTGYGQVESLKYGTRVEILQLITIGNTTWGCIKNGWISMDYVYVDGTVGEGGGAAIITGDQLNIRSGPGTNYASVGTLNSGDEVNILAQFTINGKIWGCISKGWISMDYVGVG